MNAKTDGWSNTSLKLEIEVSEMNQGWQYEKSELNRVVLEIIKTPYLNRLKQFMLRLLRNTLFWGKKAQKIHYPEISLCYLCRQHIKKEYPYFLCKTVKKLTQYLIRVINKAGF